MIETTIEQPLWRTLRLASWLVVFLLCATSAFAQRTNENVIISAEDAFGTSVGGESIGLYDEDTIRGFSPTIANNIRIEGMYFDQQSRMSNRISSGSTIRVGLATQGYPFPAPTGIVDLSLRPSGSKPLLAVTATYGPYGSQSIELDGQLPLRGSELTCAIGGSTSNQHFSEGTSATISSLGLVPRWRPADNVEVIGFWGRRQSSDSTTSPIYIPEGDYLPPVPPKGFFQGPSWARSNNTRDNLGLIVKAIFGEWTLSAATFYSRSLWASSFANLYFDVEPTGEADHYIVADPPSRYASTSGEFRISRVFKSGDFQHLVLLSTRWREVSIRNAGSDGVDLGNTSINEPSFGSAPKFQFGQQDSDSTNQKTAGLEYGFRWKQIFAADVGIQRTSYHNALVQAELPYTSTALDVWMPSASILFNINPSFGLYGNVVHGIEDAGVAPEEATNRLQLIPAIRTHQWDAGLQWKISDDSRLLIGIFDVAKPYLAIDDARLYRALGVESHRGLEVSLNLSPLEGLKVVAGAVIARPTVSGTQEAEQPVGRLAVGQPKNLVQVNAAYKLPFNRAISLDADITHNGRVAATVSNTVYVPAYTTVDLGARYKFNIGHTPAVFRLAAKNVTNRFSWTVDGSGAYESIDRFSVVAKLTVDL